MGELCARGSRGLFRSDREFEGFIDPISNPVLSKDPRSSTYARRPRPPAPTKGAGGPQFRPLFRAVARHFVYDGGTPFSAGAAMQINLYHRTYRAKGAPVALSLTPFPTHQRHTFTVGTVVHEAVYKELRVIVPDDATIDPLKRLLSWSGASGAVKSTAQEVYDMAAAGAPGFGLGK